MPSWEFFQPFIVTGLALGGVYALSGVGLVVLYRATGVLNLAFGAIGALSALIAWQIVDSTGGNVWLACGVGVLAGGVLTTAYGMVFGSALAGRSTLVKAVASLGLMLILMAAMNMVWSANGGATRSLRLPTDGSAFSIGQVEVNWTQLIALGFGIAVTLVTGAFLRFTKLGIAMRAMANDREITATLGVPVRRVEATAWFGSGLLSGVAGVLLGNLVTLDAVTLTFFVIAALAPVLVAQLHSIVITFVAAIVMGLVNALMTPIQALTSYRDLTPFVLAAVALVVLNRKSSVAMRQERF